MDDNEETTISETLSDSDSRMLDREWSELALEEKSDHFLGRRFGDIYIERQLGKGGFGEVYLGIDEKLKRKVAVKFLLNPQDSIHDTLFQREANALAALSKHANIVTIHQWGDSERTRYFVLEYVADNACNLLKNNPKGLPATQACRIAAEAADALAFAHKHGILHRDIKPANILIEEETGAVKLTDFGLAKFFAEKDQGATLTGGISGSPPYMSPEQARGQALTERSDIFSLGVTLYELLSGELPYEGDSLLEIIERVKENRRVPLSNRAPECPRPVLDIVERAMAHDPKDRFQTAEEMRLACQRVLRSSTETVTVRALPARDQLKRRAPLLAAGVMAALVLLASVTWFALNPRAPGTDIMAEAAGHLEQGDYAEAIRSYELLIAARGQSDTARYGLGYAHLLNREPQEAKLQFQRLESVAWQGEGTAAVELETDPEKAKLSVLGITDNVTPYLKTLQARIYLLEKKHSEVLTLLETLAQDDFEYKWQYARCLEILGRALAEAKNYEAARRTFAALTNADDPSAQTVGADYLDVIRYRQAREERETQRLALVARIKELSQTIEDAGIQEPTEEEKWTSRPLTYILYDAERSSSRTLQEMQLLDVLPVWLQRQLNSVSPMQAVGREDLPDILDEQLLTAMLSSPEGQLQLSQIQGGRLGIYPQMYVFGGATSLSFRIVDNETSREILTNELAIPEVVDRNELQSQLAELVWSAVDEAYPTQGVLSKGKDGATINLGDALGIVPGQRFVVAPRPSYRGVAEGVHAVVESVLGTNRAVVALESEKEIAVPDTNLYVIDAEWYARHGGDKTS